MIEFECKSCSKPIRVGDELAGSQDRSPHCREAIIARAQMIFDKPDHIAASAVTTRAPALTEAA